MGAVLAAIPYETFPNIGPLRTFGLFVALGVLVGAWLAAGYAERFGVERDRTYTVATWMVLAGIVGSRLTWAATHTDQIENPVDVIAIWEGGIQFSGGFIAALVVGLPFFKKWSRVQRWQVLDGFSWGLAIGLGLGRVGCYSVGEHFGRTTDFFLATRYEGGDVREPTLGDQPLTIGTTFHNTSLYEFLYMVLLFALLSGMILWARRKGREVKPGTLVGTFLLYYGVARLLSDAVRVNDERVGSLTGAQWMCLVMIPAGLWILLRVRPRMAKLAAEAPAEEAKADDAAGADDDAAGADEPEEQEAPVAGAEPDDDGKDVEPVAEDDADAATATATEDAGPVSVAENEADEIAEPAAADAGGGDGEVDSQVDDSAAGGEADGAPAAEPGDDEAPAETPAKHT